MVEPAVVQALAAVDGLRKGRSAAREPEAVRPVDEQTIQATLQHLPTVVADMVRFQRLTGCRPGELFILRPCDVDRSGDVWTYRPGSHKTQHHDHARLVHIGPKAQAVLTPYLLRDAQTYCFSPAESEQQRLQQRHAKRITPMSVGNVPGSNRRCDGRRKVGARYTADSFRRAIHRACRKARVTPWSPNQLRHSVATEVRRRYGLEAAQVILGHTQANVTQVYAERDLQMAVAIMREVG
jgi:integrase